MPEESAKELEQYKKEREEYLNGWKRAKADLINYQKDENKRFEEIIKFANLAIIKDLISVLDSFDLALSVLEKDGSAHSAGSGQARSPQAKGVYMIKAQLEDIMKKSGLEKMASSVGGKFDPNFQETIGEIESEKPAGEILEEMERGYLLNGRVLRPARVKISKGPK